MKLNTNAIENINKVYGEKNACRFSKMLDLRIDESLGGAAIFNKNWQVTTLEDLNSMINSLTAMKEAIEEVTGIIAD